MSAGPDDVEGQVAGDYYSDAFEEGMEDSGNMRDKFFGSFISVFQLDSSGLFNNDTIKQDCI